MSRRTDLYREVLEHENRLKAKVQELLGELDRVEAQKDVLQASFVKAQEAAAAKYTEELEKRDVAILNLKDLIRRLDRRYRVALQAGQHFPDQEDEKMLDEVAGVLQ